MKAPYIIAEVGSTHDGSLGNAKCMVELAASLGINCIKFQLHISEEETLRNAPMPPWFKGEPRWDYFKRTGFTPTQWKELKELCDEKKIDFLCSAFSEKAVEILEGLGVTAHKVASGEVTNLPLLITMAKTKKRIYLSSGMSTWEELDAAVKTILAHGCNDLVVFQCTTEYPCQPENAGLNVLHEMNERYVKGNKEKVSLGFSDHTFGAGVACAALCQGASVFEKHITFSRSMFGSDAKNATLPEEFKLYIKEIRDAHIALISLVDKNAFAATDPLPIIKVCFEKSCIAASDLPAGHTLSLNDIRFKKPGDGISAAKFEKVVGKKLKHAIKADHKLRWEDLG